MRPLVPKLRACRPRAVPRAVPLAAALSAVLLATPALGDGFSLRFFGNGVAAPGLDRVEIPLDAPHRPVDAGTGDLTVEWWMKALAGENAANPCFNGNDNWIYGNILLDRDVFGPGDWGDWGVSLFGGVVAFGAADQSTGNGVCGVTVVADGEWHHVAVDRRASDGRMRIYVDGAIDAEISGPSGDLTYRDGRATSYPASDPLLVVGAEKHDAGAEFPSFSGWIDELRLSDSLRYDGAFTPPTAAFVPDPATAALYHFDEGSGDTVGDASGAAGGPSDGARRFGGTPAGPLWSTDTPFELPCSIDRETSIDNIILGGDETFEACDLLVVGPAVDIVFPAHVVLRARGLIRLDNGVTVADGARLDLELDPSLGL